LRIKALAFVTVCAALFLPLALFQVRPGNGGPVGEAAAAAAAPRGAFPRLPAAGIGGRWISQPPPPSDFSCPLPDLPVRRTAGCDEGEPYPGCRWQIPPERKAGGLYKVWWRTPPEELWGSSSLVRLILSSLTMYRQRYGDDDIYVGDLDAPESRHISHREGVDADIYLLRWMEWIQVKDARYVNNMSWRTEESKKLAREKVLHLAKSFAQCSGGKVQIFYNDPSVVGPANEWFDASGYTSPLGPMMISHNDTHHDHFHVRIPKTW
jgi:hypothetical protein